MKTVILWNDSMPVSVLDTHINDYLMKGYRSTPPDYLQSAIDEVSDIEAGEQSAIALSETGVSINNAVLKELITGLNIPTAVGKKVIENRPYYNVEDLIAKVPGTEWVALDKLINYAE